ncbi:MAG: ChpI protein [Acidimicrobiia bacterium]|jgi:metal-responsive CopG/Arc/MetJ family transcriptional regulator|nr:ChpI protein [Acidimicrobiia bacterium]
MKVAVSIPDPLFQAAEDLARRQRRSRSDLYARALEHLLAAEGDDEITARLDAVYAAHDGTLDPGLAIAQAHALRRDG